MAEALASTQDQASRAASRDCLLRTVGKLGISRTATIAALALGFCRLNRIPCIRRPFLAFPCAALDNRLRTAPAGGAHRRKCRPPAGRPCLSPGTTGIARRPLCCTLRSTMPRTIRSASAVSVLDFRSRGTLGRLFASRLPMIAHRTFFSPLRSFRWIAFYGAPPLLERLI